MSLVQFGECWRAAVELDVGFKCQFKMNFIVLQKRNR